MGTPSLGHQSDLLRTCCATRSDNSAACAAPEEEPFGGGRWAAIGAISDAIGGKSESAAPWEASYSERCVATIKP